MIRVFAACLPILSLLSSCTLIATKPLWEWALDETVVVESRHLRVTDIALVESSHAAPSEFILEWPATDSETSRASALSPHGSFLHFKQTGGDPFFNAVISWFRPQTYQFQAEARIENRSVFTATVECVGRAEIGRVLSGPPAGLESANLTFGRDMFDLDFARQLAALSDFEPKAWLKSGVVVQSLAEIRTAFSVNSSTSLPDFPQLARYELCIEAKIRDAVREAAQTLREKGDAP